MTYIIDLIIPLWKKFISEATTAEFLNIYRFSQTPVYFGRKWFEQPRLPRKMGAVYWSWGLVRHCAKILISFVDGSFQQPSLFIQFLSPQVLWTVSHFLLILSSKFSESADFVFVNVLVLLCYCYLWSAPIVWYEVFNLMTNTINFHSWTSFSLTEIHEKIYRQPT